MLLTERQLTQVEEQFVALLENIIDEHYEVDPAHETTEEDLYITSVVLEHFVENYRLMNVNESIFSSVYGVDPNTSLYMEIEEMLLDESVGKFVAGAVHGIGGLIAKLAKKKAQRKAAGAKVAASMAKQKATTTAKAAKAGEKTNKGLMGVVKSGFQQARAQKSAEKSDAAQTRASVAASERDAAANRAKAAEARKKKLANKIDTGIQDIKNKAKEKITAGAHRIGSAIGRLAA